MYDIKLDYGYWTAGTRIQLSCLVRIADNITSDEILQAILPEELCDGSPTGFAITGHLGMRWLSSVNDKILISGQLISI